MLRADIDSANDYDDDAVDDVTREDVYEEILFGNCYPFLAIARQYLSNVSSHQPSPVH